MVTTVSTIHTLDTVVTAKPCLFIHPAYTLEIYDSYHNYHKSTIYHKFVRLSIKIFVGFKTKRSGGAPLTIGKRPRLHLRFNPEIALYFLSCL
jgi:hypothetical protein